MKISRSKIKEVIEKVFFFFVLQIAAGGIIILLLKSGGADASSSSLLQAIWFVIYLITFCLIVVRHRQFIRVAKRDKLLLLLVGIAVASVLWSAAPTFTLRRSVALVGTTLVGIYLAMRYSSTEIFRLLLWTLTIGSFLSVVFAVVLPGYGLSPGGEWRGIYQHKNILGRMASLNAVLLLIAQPRQLQHRLVVWAGIGVSIGLILLSASAGALVIFLALLVVLPIYRLLRWNYRIAIPLLCLMLIVIGCATTWFVLNVEDIVVNQLGKDLTLTGRTDLWAACIEMIQKHPFLGYGYSAFWRGWRGPSASIMRLFNWEPPHSHNGLIDLWLDLGLVGVTVFVLQFLLSFAGIGKRASLTKTAEDLWLLIPMTCMILFNITESAIILKQNNFFWILYVATVLARPDRNTHARKSPTEDAVLIEEGMNPRWPTSLP